MTPSELEQAKKELAEKWGYCKQEGRGNFTYKPTPGAFPEFSIEIDALLAQHREMVLEEVKEGLLKQTHLMKYTNEWPSQAVPIATIREIPALFRKQLTGK